MRERERLCISSESVCGLFVFSLFEHLKWYVQHLEGRGQRVGGTGGVGRG